MRKLPPRSVFTKNRESVLKLLSWIFVRIRSYELYFLSTRSICADPRNSLPKLFGGDLFRKCGD